MRAHPFLPVALMLLATPAVAQEASTEASVADEAAAPTGPTTYTVQNSSDLYVIIRNDTSATMSGLGHDHVIYASRVRGEVVWPSAPGQACSIDITVPVKELVVDPPGFRERAGLDDNTIDDDQKEKLKRNMWGRSQLDADEHPTVRFRSDDCSGVSGDVTVSGTMTIRGAAEPITVKMKVSAADGSFTARGSFDTTHTAFDFKPYAASLFGPRNQDRLTFAITVKAKAD